MTNNSFESDLLQEQTQVLAEGQNLIKACLFNLIVISEDLQSALHCQELVRIITEKFPCRIIFVRADVTAQSDYLHITRSIQSIGSGSSTICCDQIVIEASMSQTHKVPFIIFPQIVPDLPIYILLGKDPSEESNILPVIKKYATRVIYDPPSIENYHRFAMQMLHLIEEDHVDFVDMSWARTRAWREVIGRVFASFDKIESLNSAKLIQITYVGSSQSNHDKAEIQAIYIQAWIAAQLGWSLLSVERHEGSIQISYRHKDSPITLSIVSKDTGTLDQGAIYSIEVMCHDEAHFLISHGNETKYVTVHASNRERCEMPFSLFLSNYQRGSALVSEIFYQTPSTHYKNMLHALNNEEWSK